MTRARLAPPAWEARTPLPGETPPATLPAWNSKDKDRLYIRTRDNPDLPFRPGSQDFLTKQSRGYRT